MHGDFRGSLWERSRIWGSGGYLCGLEGDTGSVCQSAREFRGVVSVRNGSLSGVLGAGGGHRTAAWMETLQGGDGNGGAGSHDLGSWSLPHALNEGDQTQPSVPQALCVCVCLSVSWGCSAPDPHPPAPHIWTAAAYFFLCGCNTPILGTFLPGLCQTPTPTTPRPAGREGGPHPGQGGPGTAPDPHAIKLITLRSEKGDSLLEMGKGNWMPPELRKGDRSLPIMGKGDLIPTGAGEVTRSLPVMGKSDLIPSGAGEG